MSVSNSPIYLKAASITFLPLTSAYCLNTVLSTLSPFTPFLTHKNDLFINQYLADPSFAFFSLIFLLPMLSGYITDRISVFTALRWLGSTYIISAGIFAIALTTSSPWLPIACFILFGLSLNAACVVLYAYLCEHAFRTSDYMENFTKAIGVCFTLGMGTFSILKFINIKDEMTNLIIAGVLLFVSICSSFLLSRDNFFMRVLAEQLPASASSSLVARRSIIFNTEENEEVLLAEQMNEINQVPEDSFLSLKILGSKGLTSLFSLSILVGLFTVIRQEKQRNVMTGEWLYYADPIQYALFAMAGLFISWGKWNKNILEKTIIGMAGMYLFVIIFDEALYSSMRALPVFVIENLIAGSCLILGLLYIPYLIGFRINMMGKIVGLFGWFFMIAKFIQKLNNMVVGNSIIPFDLLSLGCVALACLAFTAMTVKSWSVKERKVSQGSSINI